MKELAPVGGATKSWGVITAPNHKGIPLGIKQGKSFGIDPGCLDGPSFVKRVNLSALLDYLPILEPYKAQCLFLAVPDVVGNSEETLNAYEEFRRYFTDWPLAYVAQNGSENLPIPEDCQAVFIGGMPMLDRPLKVQKNGKIVYMDWKDSPEAASVIKRAIAMGKHIHIGRVNWYRRFKIFTTLDGYENFTFDGTRTRYDGSDKAIQAWQDYQLQRPLVTIDDAGRDNRIKHTSTVKYKKIVINATQLSF